MGEDLLEGVIILIFGALVLSLLAPHLAPMTSLNIGLMAQILWFAAIALVVAMILVAFREVARALA